MENQTNQITEIKELSTLVVRSGITRESFEQVAVKALLARSFGLDPIQGVLGFDLITTQRGTQVFMKPVLMEARVRASGKYKYVIKELDDKICRLVWYEKFDDKWMETGEISFTIEEAERQGLAKKDNWLRVPKEMLFYRCLARAVRLLASDVIFGMPVYLSGVEEWDDTNNFQVVKSEEERNRILQEITLQFSMYINTLQPDPEEESEVIDLQRVVQRFSNYGLDGVRVWKLFFGDQEPTKFTARAFLGFFGLLKNQTPEVSKLEQLREVL